jgi:hypothetical protein
MASQLVSDAIKDSFEINCPVKLKNPQPVFLGGTKSLPSSRLT